MKSRFAAVSLLAALSALLVPGLGSPARAQDLTVAAPPAYAVATRLVAQADAAKAAGQPEIAHRRAYQAIRKYGEVVASRTYGKTPFAAEALYHTAQLQEQYYDKNTAAQTLKTLRNNFGGVDYPDKAVAVTGPSSALARLETEADHENKTHYPGSILYAVLDFLVKLWGGVRNPYSYALAILTISLFVRLLITPLSNQQYKSMKEMQRLQPYIKEMQAKYKNDKEAQGRKMMELYKEHGVNPAAGCLPLLIQLPIMYVLYYMIRLYEYQFAHGHFFWIGSPLSAWMPTVFAPDLSQADIPLLVLYALSMYVTQKMTITPSVDPAQAEQQRTMAIITPFMSTYFFWTYHWPSAFVLYYLIFNILSTAQQQYYMRKRAGDAPPSGDGGDGGSKKPIILPPTNGNGTAKALPGVNGSTPAGRRVRTGRDVPIAEAQGTAAEAGGDKFSRPHASNGVAPTARGVIAPKVHPKKKRR